MCMQCAYIISPTAQFLQLLLSAPYIYLQDSYVLFLNNPLNLVSATNLCMGLEHHFFGALATIAPNC